jgi:hypothetical protein
MNTGRSGASRWQNRIRRPRVDDALYVVDSEAAPREGVNVPRRPSSGTGEFVFEIAVNRWRHHPAGDDGLCLAPGCGQVWPCGDAADAELVLNGCLTYWAVLDQQPNPRLSPGDGEVSPG